MVTHKNNSDFNWALFREYRRTLSSFNGIIFVILNHGDEASLSHQLYIGMVHVFQFRQMQVVIEENKADSYEKLLGILLLLCMMHYYGFMLHLRVPRKLCDKISTLCGTSYKIGFLINQTSTQSVLRRSKFWLAKLYANFVTGARKTELRLQTI